MTEFVRCRMCGLELRGEECLFATHRRVIGGREYLFCCERHADEFEKKMAKK
jgi:YHS domain-containing protein